MASTAQPTSTSLPKGVAPLRAGTGNSFLWRRLHSLTGIVPVGLFLLEHFLSNAEAINGVAAYNAQVKFLTGLPFRLALEIFGIFIPLAFHALYGVYIWWRGENNVIDYPWTGNWFYTAAALYRPRRLCLCDLHIWTMRFTGIHLTEHSDASFWKVQHELAHPLALAFYVVGILAASWHFGYGLFLFAAKWGIVTGDKARKRAQGVGIALSVLLVLAGIITIYAFVAKYQTQQCDPDMGPAPSDSAPADQSRMIPSSIPSSQAR